MHHYLTCFRKFADFAGRSHRAEYWLFMLFNVLVAVAIQVVALVANVPEIGLIGLVYGAVALLPGLAVFIRRLHDTGRSGWWMLIGLVPLIGAIALLVFLVQPGEAGENDFGPRPA